MFKKTDENEWSRFSKALSNKEREATAGEEEVDVPDSSSSPEAEQAISPSTPRSPHDVNVSVTRGRATSPEGHRDVETLIGDRSFFDGVFKAEEAIRIRGTVQGELESKRSVFVEEQAKVTAKVTGASVTVAGQVNGQIHSAGRVEIKPTGRVTGEITAGTLVMMEGAFFEGHLKMAAHGPEVLVSEAANSR